MGAGLDQAISMVCGGGDSGNGVLESLKSGGRRGQGQSSRGQLGGRCRSRGRWAAFGDGVGILRDHGVRGRPCLNGGGRD